MQVIIFPDFYPFIYLIDDLRCNQEDFNYTTPARFIKEGNWAVTGGKRQPFAGGLKIAPRLAGDEASMIKIVLLSLYLIKWRSPGVLSNHSHVAKQLYDDKHICSEYLYSKLSFVLSLPMLWKVHQFVQQSMCYITDQQCTDLFLLSAHRISG